MVVNGSDLNRKLTKNIIIIIIIIMTKKIAKKCRGRPGCMSCTNVFSAPTGRLRHFCSADPAVLECGTELTFTCSSQ